MFSSVSVPAELSNQRFDKVVAELTPDLSRSKIKQLILVNNKFIIIKYIYLIKELNQQL